MATHRKIDAGLLGGELVFTASRSGGPGGQNVNKVSSRVTLQLDVGKSLILTPDEKVIISEKLSAKMTREGVLLISSQETRSQVQNKELAIAKFEQLMSRAFARQKVRKATKPSKASRKERIKKKKVHSEKKKWRRKPGVSE